MRLGVGADKMKRAADTLRSHQALCTTGCVMSCMAPTLAARPCRSVRRHAQPTWCLLAAAETMLWGWDPILGSTLGMQVSGVDPPLGHTPALPCCSSWSLFREAWNGAQAFNSSTWRPQRLPRPIQHWTAQMFACGQCRCMCTKQRAAAAVQQGCSSVLGCVHDRADLHREHLERKLAVMERQMLGGQASASAPANPDKLARQQRLLQYHAEMVSATPVLMLFSVPNMQEGCRNDMFSLAAEHDLYALDAEHHMASLTAKPSHPGSW